MDQSRTPILDALADYHAKGRYGFLRSGLAAGMTIPDASDSKLEHFKVVA